MSISSQNGAKIFLNISRIINTVISVVEESPILEAKMPRQETYIEEKSAFVDLLIPFLPQICFGTPQQRDEAQRTVFQLGAHLNFIKEKAC